MTRIESNGGRRAGFTLVEILIAMAVFLIGVVAIIGVFPEGMRTSSKSVDDTVASYVVQSVRDALVDSLRRNLSDEQESPTDDFRNGYWVRWFHDGLPETGATFRLARTFPTLPATGSNPGMNDPLWGDSENTKYSLPDYLMGAAPGVVDFDPATAPTVDNPNNPSNCPGGASMLEVYANPSNVQDNESGPFDGTPPVSLMRGWWWPDMCLSNAIPKTGAVNDAWGSTLCTADKENGGADGTHASLGNNDGIEVVKLGSLTSTTAEAKVQGVQFPDPLGLYSFQFCAGIFNDLTPGGDATRHESGGYMIPDSPFPGEWDLFPTAFFPDYYADPAAAHDTTLTHDNAICATRDANRIRKDYRPGLEKFTFFPFKNWRYGMTGTEAAGTRQWTRDREREQNCIRLFQFLVSFTQ